jgi:hypothetical protein
VALDWAAVEEDFEEDDDVGHSDGYAEEFDEFLLT